MLARVGGVVGLIGLIIWIYAIVDSLTVPAQRVRFLPKGLWVLVVLIFNVLGAALWFLLGKPHRFAAATGGGTPSFGSDSSGHTGTSGFTAPTFPIRPRAPRRNIAPDDNPEFLRHLAEDLRKRSNDPTDPRDKPEQQ